MFAPSSASPISASRPSSRVLTRLLAAISALIALCSALFLTRAPGPGVSPDSASYLCASECLARGEAPRVPIAAFDNATGMERLQHFPPGFPALTAIPIALGVPVRQAARWVEAVAFATTAALAVVAAGAAAGPLAAGLAGAMLVVTPAIVELHALVLSEPLFLACLMSMIVLMVRAPGRAWSIGIVAAAAVLVRYAGVALILAAAGFAIMRPADKARRASAGLAASLPGLIALGTWRLWAGPFRKYEYRSQTSLDFQEAWQTIVDWLVPSVQPIQPSPMRSAIAVGAVLAIAVALRSRWQVRARETDPEHRVLQRLLLASAVVSVCYVAVVVASKSFADPGIPFDWRLMSPIILLTEICLAAALVTGWRGLSPDTRTASVFALSLWFFGSSHALARLAVRIHDQGLGYESADWQRSELAHWLHSEGKRYALYTNDPTGIWHISELTSRLLPDKRDANTLGRFETWFRRRPSALVGFADSLEDSVPPAELAQRLGLRTLARFDKATVWVE